AAFELIGWGAGSLPPPSTPTYVRFRIRRFLSTGQKAPASLVPPLSASCWSGQRFAFSFPQIPNHSGHPCRSANTSPCQVCKGLSPSSHSTRHHSESNSASHGAAHHAWRTKKKADALEPAFE